MLLNVCLMKRRKGSLPQARYHWSPPLIWMFTHFCDTDHAVLRSSKAHVFMRECSLLNATHTALLLLLMRPSPQNCCNSRMLKDEISPSSQKKKGNFRKPYISSRFRITANLKSTAAALLFDSIALKTLSLWELGALCDRKKPKVIKI